MADVWAPVEAHFDIAAETGHPIRFWLRDDDAVAVTPALEQLHDLCLGAGLPILLAVIPAKAEDALGNWVAARPLVTPCQHGFSHANHAAPGERARELRGTHPLARSLEDLARGRERMRGLFGSRLVDVLVPPWNRIDEDIVQALPGLGFRALSTFGPPPAEPVPIPRLNCDLDLIDWRAGRCGRTFENVVHKLGPLLAAAGDTGQPVGILTHHLAHDETAWAVLRELLRRLRAHRGVAFSSADRCLAAPTLIRPARPEDRGAVEAVVREAYAVYLQRMGRKPGPMLDDYGRLIDAKQVHLLLLGGAVRGVVVLIPQGRTMLLDNVALAPSAQKRGYGRLLIAFAEEAARARGADTLILYTHESMTENLALYSHLGFAETHRVEERGLRRVYMSKAVRVGP